MSLPNDSLYFCVETKPQSMKFEFADEDAEIFNNILTLLNSSWIRVDFSKRYTLQDVIGKGGFASVSVAVRNSDGKLFAAKMVKKERISREKERVYFIHELKVARLLDHPLIVKTWEVHDSQGLFIVVMDYIEGVNLLQYIKVKKKLLEHVALHIIHEVLVSVRYLHEKGYVHRDIKPQNIMLKLHKEEKHLDFRTKYKIILIDFGLCAEVADHSSKSFLHDKSGTTGYLAPEVIKSHKTFYNERADLFSLGVVFVEMYTL